MEEYEEYILDIGASLDEHPLKIARHHPNWLVVCLEANEKLLGLCSTKWDAFNREESNNIAYREWDVLDPLVGLKIETPRGEIELSENLFSQAHVHYVFTSKNFRECASKKGQTLQSAVLASLENLLDVMKPGRGKHLLISGEYEEPHKLEEKKALLDALDSLGYKLDKDYKIKAYPISRVGKVKGEEFNRTFIIKKKG